MNSQKQSLKITMTQSNLIHQPKLHQSNKPLRWNTQTTDLLRRLDIKFCSYCLENNYRLPRTHSDNECLHPQLKDKHKRVSEYGNKLENTVIHLSPMKYAKSLGHLTPDVALYDQGSDVTYTCRRDLLTNVRQLATPCYFDRPKG
ncbi:hypothetical protein E3Q22_00684 [Wallemia mellicola]|uniref:Uncharacterized protein n=1 Tax=Wallemia mellicola TaxID=1708541 RepID=A0A4T0MF93_9BASI|nr:hypothetical protein E3Q24_02626 [Wallemia mellicola]TIB81859.1 hypothetical protein E3Q22_00684 [Wallemia mellicola]